VPGIVGMITNMPRRQAEMQLRRMVACLVHERFYETGTWIDEALGVYVGWVARRNSFSDRMPLYNERKDAVLVFSGEEYSEPNEKKSGDGSYLLARYEQDSLFPAGLNGRFHGLLADDRRRVAMLFNDRYGMHRIYYHEAEEAFYFAAEAKAILAVRPALRTMDDRSLGELVTCGCVLENRTIFKGIQVLPGAAAWIIRPGPTIRKATYFSPRQWEQEDPLPPKAYYQELRESFSRNLSRYFDGPESIGISLTAGLDTRMIMAWTKLRPGTFPCYSFGGTFRDCQDVLGALQVAKACGQSHEVIRVGEEFLSSFPKYAERTVYLTDACAAVNHAPDLYLNERAREIAPVRMTGNYGGEVLRRIRAFKAVKPPAGLFQGDLLPYVRFAADTYTAHVGGHPLSFAVFRQAPWHHYGLLALEETQLAIRTPYLDNDFVRTVFRAPESAFANNDTCLRLIADGNPALRQIRTDRGLGGKRGRVPALLARCLLEFSFKAEYAYDGGMPQWLARIDHVLAPLHVERLFLGRHKFSHFRIWYRDALSAYVQEILLDPRTLSRPYIQRNTLERMVRSHVNGNQNHTSAIHTMLTLELLHRQLLDRAAEPCPSEELAANT